MKLYVTNIENIQSKYGFFSFIEYNYIYLYRACYFAYANEII